MKILVGGGVKIYFSRVQNDNTKTCLCFSFRIIHLIAQMVSIFLSSVVPFNPSVALSVRMCSHPEFLIYG